MFKKIAIGLVCLFIVLVMCLSGGDKVKKITKQEYGDQWAFTVDTLYLHADSDKSSGCDSVAVYAYDDDGNLYSLNGIARSKFKNDPKAKDVSTIQQEDEQMNKILKEQCNGEPFTPVMKSIDFAIEEGLKLVK